jgi:transcription termination factor NusB
MYKKCLITLALAGALSACQTTSDLQDIKSADCFFPDAPASVAPQWVCGITSKGLEISATGYAKKNLAGLSVMNDISRNDARINLGRQFEVNVKSLIKQALVAKTTTENEGGSENVEEYFEKVVKSISSTTLTNSRIVSTIASPEGALYTLVGMDKATFDANVSKVVDKAEARDAQLWNKFNDEKTTEQLSKVLSALEK